MHDRFQPPASVRPPHRIRASMLGGLRIEADGVEITELPSQPVRCALFVYLAVERGATRDELTALFWPERSAERARHSLSQALYELRRRLGDDWLVTHGEQLSVTAAVGVDALDFIAAAETGREGDAVAAFSGPFLDGVHVGASTAVESWVARRRSQLASLFRVSCRRLGAALEEAGDVAGALAAAQRWAQMDPLDDEAHHRLVELLAAAGRRADALRCYHEYEKRIAAELDVEPLDETKQLVASIRGAGAAPRPDPPGPAVDAVPGGAASIGPVPEFTEAAVEVAAGVLPAVPPSQATRSARRRHLLALAGLVLFTLPLAAYLRGWPGARPDAAAPPASPAARATGLAVLPFANLSADPEQEYFADGIAEDLLTSLSRVDGLRVISRTSAWRYKGSELSMGEIGRELDVDWVLQGSVRRDGERVRITSQLIDAARDAHVWAETYERELTGIFELQTELAQQIADALAQRLAPGRPARVTPGRAANVAAYDLLLRGLEYLNRPGDGDVRKFAPAMHYFRAALETEPSYARAHSALSAAYRTHVGLPLATRRDSALYHAQLAVAADPQLAEARALLGWAYLISRDLERAEAELSQALRLDPNQVDALAGRARLAWIAGRLDEAVRWQRQVVALDPWAAGQISSLGGFLLDIGDLAGAESAYARAVRLAPDAPAAAFMLAQIHLLRGEPERAESVMRGLADAAAGHPGGEFLLGRFHAQRRRFELAAPVLERVADRLGGATATVALQRAFVAAALRQTQRTAELLDLAAADIADLERNGFYAPRLRLQHAALSGDAEGAVALLRRYWPHEMAGDLPAGPQIGLYWIDADPLLAGVRSHPEFRALLGEIRAEIDLMRARLEAAPPLG